MTIAISSSSTPGISTPALLTPALLANGPLTSIDEKLPLRVQPLANGGVPKAVLDWKRGWADQLLATRAGAYRDEAGFAFLDAQGNVTQEVGAPEVHARACRAATLLKRFASERSRVLLFGDNTLDYLTGFFGALYANMIPVSGVSPALAGSVARLTFLMEDAAPEIVFGARADLAAFQPLLGREAKGKKGAKWVPVEAAEQEKAETFAPWRGDRHAPAFLQYTSGSTRQPRGVAVSHENLLNNLDCQAAALGLHARGAGLSWLPFSHDMGLIGGPLLSLAGGEKIYLMQPVHFAERPRLWLEALSRYRVYFSGGPNFAYDLASRECSNQEMAEEGVQLDLSSWRVASIGAEPVSEETVRRFQARFARAGFRQDAFAPSYGMAETTLMIAAPSPEQPPTFRSFSREGLARGVAEAPRTVPGEITPGEADGRALANCGQAAPGNALAIIDPVTEEKLPDGCVGEIWASGPSVALGYSDGAGKEGAQERFGLEREGKRWFRTGDRGFFADGALYVIGRAADLLVWDGKTFDAYDLGRRLQTQARATLGEVAVFLTPTGLHALIELPEQAARAAVEEERKLAQTLERLCRVPSITFGWLHPNALPRTPSGKIRLRATRDDYQAGRLTLWREMRFDAATLKDVQWSQDVSYSERTLQTPQIEPSTPDVSGWEGASCGCAPLGSAAQREPAQKTRPQRTRAQGTGAQGTCSRSVTEREAENWET